MARHDVRLRAWQREAVHTYFAEPRRDFTVTATPGAGKTTFALTVAAHLLNTRAINRIIVVTPTDHLRTQWADAAAAFDIVLDPKLGNNAKVRANTDGYVTTYAQVASHALLHERRTESPNRALVIFDEIHHAGDGLTWGDAIAEAFTAATRRITLTGTPFRTSPTERIPFVTYTEDGDGNLRSVSDFGYGYGDAFADGVVRPVVFAAYSGVTRWRDSAGDVLAADLAEPATKKQEQAAWRSVLDPKGAWVRQVIAAAANRVAEQRAGGLRDAGCLILASDQEQARAYARVVKTVTGHTPVVVLSDDAAASKKIAAFDKGSDMFLVAVRMVSEGVDIRRLTCLVWLTSYQTPLFFAQAVGRVVRSRHPSETATVFLPAVRPLLALAAEVEASRDHVLHDKKELPDNVEDISDRERSEPSANTIETLDSEARFAHAVVGGKAITPTLPENLSPEEEAFLGLPGLLSPDEAAMLLAQREATNRRVGASQGRSGASAVKAAADATSLRKEITSLVKRWAFRRNIPIAQAHMLVRNSVPGPKNADASVEVLAERRDWLLGKLA